MGSKLILSAQYTLDMKGIIEFYTKVNENVARNIKSKIASKVEMLVDCPEMGKLIIQDQLSQIRMLVCGDYVIIYKYAGDEVIVRRIINHYQDYAKYM